MNDFSINFLHKHSINDLTLLDALFSVDLILQKKYFINIKNSI